jgi:DNA-binding CsgD family transcriptional regulator
MAQDLLILETIKRETNRPVNEGGKMNSLLGKNPDPSRQSTALAVLHQPLIGGDESPTLRKPHLLALDRLRSIAVRPSDPPDFDAASREILEVLQSSIRFDAAWLLKFDPRSLNLLGIHLDRFSQKAFSGYLDFFYTRPPFPRIREIRNQGHLAVRGSSLVGGLAWEKSPFFKELIEPLGLRFFLIGACVDEKGGYTGLMTLWRDHNRYDFSRGDVFFLQKASVHCARLLNRIDRVGADAGRHEVSSLMKRRAYPGVAVLGGADKILYMNREAKTLLGVFHSGKKHLSSTGEEDFLDKVRRLRKRVLNPSAEDGGKNSQVEIFKFRGTTFSLRGIALQGAGENKELAMILIETVQDASEPSPMLHRLPDLTAREGAVARLVGRGLTNKEIASELGIGVHTVKDHIKRIMDKLQTTTRAGVAAKIMIG